MYLTQPGLILKLVGFTSLIIALCAFMVTLSDWVYGDRTVEYESGTREQPKVTDSWYAAGDDITLAYMKGVRETSKQRQAIYEELLHNLWRY